MALSKRLSLAAVGPGLLVAATGVGAGDLATAGFTGAALGVGILWAVPIGGLLKYSLNEGLARWQLATGSTLLEGLAKQLGPIALWSFLAYLLVWTYLVAMALMSACGVAANALFPMFDDLVQGKVVFGVLHSLLAAAMVWVGGYRLFEKIMSVCIGSMFVVVVGTAFAIRPKWSDVLSGLVVPQIPEFTNGGLAWTLALLGGVGGTVTVLCYGYWIREEDRTDLSALKTCRLDLGLGYGMTVVFGIAMVIIGSQIGRLDASGASLIVEIANTLEERLGSIGAAARLAFLIGAWGAVFSSLLGVWQSIPYLFCDIWQLIAKPNEPTQPSRSNTALYRIYLGVIAVLPISGLVLFNFKSALKLYGVIGAMFIPLLTIALLILNNSQQISLAGCKNSVGMNLVFVIALLVFLLAGSLQIGSTLGWM